MPPFSKTELAASAAIIVATLFNTMAQVTVDKSNAMFLFKNSACVLSLCFFIENVLHTFIPSCQKPYVLTHFVLGWIQQLCYLILYFVEFDSFMTYWRPIFFGYYIWTMILLATRPNLFFPIFHIFYSIHHCLAFFITGVWALQPNPIWEGYMVRAAMIWLTSDIYVYSNNIYRALDPSRGKTKFFRQLQIGAFCAERIHRCAAYLQALIICKGTSTPFGWVVFGTMISIDLLDITFQLYSILNNRRKDDKELPATKKENRTFSFFMKSREIASFSSDDSSTVICRSSLQNVQVINLYDIEAAEVSDDADSSSSSTENTHRDSTCTRWLFPIKMVNSSGIDSMEW